MSRLKGLLGMFTFMSFVPYTIQKIYEDESVEVKDPGYLKVFIFMGNELRVLPHTEKALEMVSPMLVEP